MLAVELMKTSRFSTFMEKLSDYDVALVIKKESV